MRFGTNLNTAVVGRLAAMLGIGLGLLIPTNVAIADSPVRLEELTAAWWQWGLSTPTAINPMLDATGGNCMMGQHGSIWFLAGSFFGGTASRSCDIPENTPLFFPVINSINFNTPNVCGQDGTNLTVRDLRQFSASFLNTAMSLSVEVDGRANLNMQRIQSDVFSLALPQGNVFDPLCASLGGVPARVYSPAVDDGYYVMLDPLKTGAHTLRIRANTPSFNMDVTYTLHVVPVLKK